MSRSKSNSVPIDWNVIPDLYLPARFRFQLLQLQQFSSQIRTTDASAAEGDMQDQEGTMSVNRALNRASMASTRLTYKATERIYAPK